MASDPRLPHIPQSKRVVPSNWSWSQLGDACAGVFDCPHSTPKITDEGPLVVRTQDILSGVFRADQAAHVSHETYLERIGKAEPRFGDLLYSREGTYFGIAAQVPPDQRVCLGQRMVLLRPNPKIVNPRFLCYWLNSPTMARHVAGYRDGSVAERLNLPTIRALPVVLPPLTEQDDIARVLGALDDKIELNRRMNETLEATARALFKSWFIDFDPVHAKAEGRDPGLPADIAALFPDSFEDSDVGEIPRGWTAGRFGNVVSQRTERLRDRPAVVLSAMAAGELVNSDEHFTKRVYSQEIGKYLAVEQWDFAYNPSRVNIGSIGMLKEPLLGGVSPVYVVFRPQVAYRWFVEFSLREPSTKQWIKTLASGSVRQSLSYADFASLPCVVPPETTIARFDEVWTGLRAGILLRSDESRTLAALRDTLLPKLLSGELKLGIAGPPMGDTTPAIPVLRVTDRDSEA